MQGQGTDWRWSYAEMQQLKQQDEPKSHSLAEGNLSQNTEIFIMLPLGIITVGELSDGEDCTHGAWLLLVQKMHAYVLPMAACQQVTGLCENVATAPSLRSASDP